MPPKSPAKSKRGAAYANLDKGRQLGLMESFGRSPKRSRRSAHVDDTPLEEEVTPHVYDNFMVKYLETEGTARGFKSNVDAEEEDIRLSGAFRTPFACSQVASTPTVSSFFFLLMFFSKVKLGRSGVRGRCLLSCFSRSISH